MSDEKDRGSATANSNAAANAATNSVKVARFPGGDRRAEMTVPEDV